MYIHTHTNIHVYIHTYANTVGKMREALENCAHGARMHVYTHTHTNIHVYIHTYANTVGKMREALENCARGARMQTLTRIVVYGTEMSPLYWAIRDGELVNHACMHVCM